MHKYKIQNTKRLLSIFLLASNMLIAEHAIDTPKKSWIDSAYFLIKDKVCIFSCNFDKKISNYIYELDENKTKSNYDNDKTISTDNWIASFFNDIDFKDNNLKEKYKRSNLRVKTTLKYDKKRKKTELSISAKAKLILPKTKDRLSLIIDNEDEDSYYKDYNFDNNEKVKLVYSKQSKSLIKQSASLGIGSFDNPYIKGKMYIPYRIGKWKNRIDQYVKYSRKYKFEERTNLYLDRVLKDDSFLRLNVGRRTRNDFRGMEFYANISYHDTSIYDRGLQIGFSSIGKTKPETKINKYTIYSIYKKSIWREWLYYEIEPRIEWERTYDFDVNYVILFSLEIFFGDN